MMRLRQVAWVAADLASAEAAVESTLGVERCFRDPGVGTFGLHNALFPVGDQFLEIVSPLPDAGDTAGGRHLERQGGDAGYMVILQTDELDAVRERAAAAKVRIIFEAPGGDEAEGTAIRGIHFHPKDVGGAILSIDQSQEPGEWAWAGPDWRHHVRTDGVRSLSAVTIEVPDPVAAAETWSALLGRPTNAERQIEIDDATISFVTGTGGVAGLGMAGPSARSFDLLGTRVDVSP